MVQGQQKTAGMFEGADGIDVRDFLVLLWRRKILIVVMLVLGVGLAFTVLSTIKPRYTASALILIQNNSAQQVSKDLVQLLKSKTFDTTFILTELEILKSRNLASQVIKRLDLINDPEFGAEAKGSADASEQYFRDLSVDGTKLKTLPPEAIDGQVTSTVTNFLEHLKVNSIPGSIAVRVSFTSENPYKAALISNAVVNVYKGQKAHEDVETQRRLTGWLDARLKALRAQVFEAETEIQAYKADNELAEKKIDIISADQIAELNAQLIKAQADRSEIQVTLGQLKKEGALDGVSSLSFGNDSASVMKALRLEEARLKSDISELSNRYGHKHPKIKKKNSEVESVRASLELEQKKIRGALQTEFKIADARVRDIERQISEAAQEISENTDALIKLRELEREVDSSRLVLKTFLETYKRSVGRDGLQASGVKVISDASVPQVPSYPNKLLFIALGAFLSLFLTVVFIVLVEKSTVE